MKTLLLIDGSNFLYRAFHGLPDLRTSAGEPTGAIKGFANMLHMLRTTYKPDLAACVFDAPGQTFRSQWYEAYKANRPAMPEDLRSQIEPIHQMLHAKGWPVLQVPGIEADDVIGTLSRLAMQEDFRVIVASGDKDMCQLVNDKVTVINTMSKSVLDIVGVKNKFGIMPHQIIDYLALMGDAVDNVPGVKKCGPKTAAKWLNEYGSLDAIMAAADAFKGKAGEYLREGLEFLPLARRLVTIKVDADTSEWLPQGLASLTFKEEKTEELVNFYARWEMQQSRRRAKQSITEPEKHAPAAKKVILEDLTADLFAQIPQESPEEAVKEMPIAQIQVLDGPESLEHWTEKLNKTTRPVCLTAWADLTEGMKSQPIGLAMKIDEALYYCPIQNSQEPQTQAILSRLQAWLDQAPRVVAADAKLLAHRLTNAGLTVKANFDDVSLMSYVIEAHMKHDLANLANRWLKQDIVLKEDVLGKGAKAQSVKDAPMKVVLPYLSTRLCAIDALYQKLNEQMLENADLQSIYREIELPTQRVLFIMERNGVLVDSLRLGAQSDALGDAIVGLEEKAYELAGQRFNLASPKQLSEVLFTKMALPVPPKTKKTASGGYSTNEEVLQQLALDYPLPKIVLEYRRLSKLKSTYTDKLPMMVCPKTGRVHTTFGQTTAVTGRLASSDPNLQNIPVRTAEGRQVREAFVAESDHAIVSADYSQIELRIMAHLSQDAGLLKAFQDGEDIHRATAAEVFGVAREEVTSDQRRMAKVINFGLIYGMSAFGLAQNLNIAPSAARNYIDRYFARYPGVKAYMDSTRAQAHAQGYVQTAFGRRLWLPDIASSRAPVRAAAERAAINAPMQGTAADLIKKAMIATQNWIEQEKLQSRLILQVHDELILEVPASEQALVTRTLPELMKNVAQLSVALIAEVGVGESWESAH